MSSINRKPHCLKRERTLAMPRHIIFFDTETEQTEWTDGSVTQELKLGWAVYYRKSYGRHLSHEDWLFFKDAETFWQFVFSHCQKKIKLWLIARNIPFDFTIVRGFQYLGSAGFKLRFFHNSGTTTVISVRGDNGSIVLADSMNWFRESLAETGERIGLPKLSIDFETASFLELNIYCRRDVEIELENFKGFIRFLEAEQISRLRYTIGSTAWSAYLYRFYRHKIYIHNNSEAIDLERESYKGGRVECFYLGEKRDENYYSLDVNSLYPAVMQGNLYPVKYKRFMHKTTLPVLRDCLRKYAVISSVLLETDEPVYAVKRDRTIFPVGSFWTVLTTGELKYAFKNGHIKDVKSAVIYEQADLFSVFVKRFYALRMQCRQQGKKQYAECCKLILNSLYGKFGQKAEIWEKIGSAPGERDRVESVFYEGRNEPGAIRYLLGDIFELTGYEECYNSFPAISSHVTAFGRLYLWSLMKQAGEGNYFYCDTDSLIVNEEGIGKLKNRIHESRLGLLKLEGKSNVLSIRGLKDYSFSGKSVIKGISKNAVKLSDNVYEQESWPSFKGLLKSSDVNEYRIKKTTKVLTRKYSKGEVNADGSITPFCFDAELDSALSLF